MNETQDKIKELMLEDTEGPKIAWDKGEPKYVITTEPKTFYVKNLKDWCDFYEVSYQMLCRFLREGKGNYRGIKVHKV